MTENTCEGCGEEVPGSGDLCPACEDAPEGFRLPAGTASKTPPHGNTTR